MILPKHLFSFEHFWWDIFEYLYTKQMTKQYNICSQDFEVAGLLKDMNVLQVWLKSAVTYAAERSRAHSSYKVPPECPPAVQKGECHVNFIRKVL